MDRCDTCAFIKTCPATRSIPSGAGAARGLFLVQGGVSVTRQPIQLKVTFLAGMLPPSGLGDRDAGEWSWSPWSAEHSFRIHAWWPVRSKKILIFTIY